MSANLTSSMNLMFNISRVLEISFWDLGYSIGIKVLSWQVMSLVRPLHCMWFPWASQKQQQRTTNLILQIKYIKITILKMGG